MKRHIRMVYQHIFNRVYNLNEWHILQYVLQHNVDLDLNRKWDYLQRMESSFLNIYKDNSLFYLDDQELWWVKVMNLKRILSFMNDPLRNREYVLIFYINRDIFLNTSHRHANQKQTKNFIKFIKNLIHRAKVIRIRINLFQWIVLFVSL